MTSLKFVFHLPIWVTLIRDISNYWAVVVLLVSMGGCAYVPDDVFFNKVPPVDANSIQIVLMSPANPIAVSGPTQFTFDIIVPGKKKFAYEATVEGISITKKETNVERFSFTLDPSTLATGPHKLTMTVAYSSGSGSLADVLDREVVVAKKEFSFEAKLAPPTLPTGVAAPVARVQDGKSLVSVNIPIDNSILRYYLLRQYYDDSDHVFETDTLGINVPGPSDVHDVSYVGGKVGYTVVLKGFKFELRSPTTFLNIDPNFEVTYDSTKVTPLFTWTRPALYGNQLRVDVRASGDSPIPVGIDGGGFLISSNVSTKYLGQSATFTITLRSIDPNVRKEYTRTKWAHQAAWIPKFEAICYVPQQSSYVLISVDKLIKLNQALGVTGKIDLDGQSGDGSSSLVISSDGQYAYVQQGADNSKVLKVKLSDMTIVTTINLPGILTHPYSSIYRALRLTDNNLLVVKTNNYDYVIDLALNQVVKEFNFATVAISDDGQFIANFNMVYKRGATDWNSLGTFPIPTFFNTLKVYLRKRNGNNQALTQSSSGVVLYDLDGALDGNGDFPTLPWTTFQGGYDPDKDLWYTYSNLGGVPITITVFDPISFASLGTIQFTGSPNELVYLNGRFFHKAGFASNP